MEAAEDASKPKAEELSVDVTRFEELERDFQDVLNTLVKDNSLDKFRREYEKLHAALKKSHEQEKRLVKRCRELNAEIVNNAAKVQTALKLSQEDQNTIAALKKEIEKAWKMVDASHEKELRAKETIQKLRAEITNLSRLVEQGAGLSIGQDNTVNELLKLRDELTRKLEESASANDKLTKDIDELQAKMERKRGKKREMMGTITELREVVAQRKAEHEREQRRKERMNKELQELKTKLENKAKEQQNLHLAITEQEERTAKLEADLREAQSTSERQARDHSAALQQIQTMSEDAKQQVRRIESLGGETLRLEQEVKAREQEIRRAHEQLQSAQRKVDKEHKRVMVLEDAIGQERTQRDVMLAEMKSVQKELDARKRHEEQLTKMISSLQHEAGILQKQLMRSSTGVKKQEEKTHMAEQSARALENEIYQFKQEASKQRKLIYQLETDRERYGINANEAHAKLLQAQEEIKLKEMQIAELNKKLADAENRLKQQQQLYEAVRSDRNLYSKNLIEAQDEIAEMKRKFKIMNHQIEQLKEEITAKDSALVKEHMALQKLQQQKEQLKHELSKVRSIKKKADRVIEKMSAENEKLNHMISKMDAEALSQRKEYDQVINERDILGTQLIRRNDELALLYEKIKIMQSTLRKGEAQYRDRLADIRMLKLKVADLKRELRIAKNQMGRMDTLEKEVFRLQREVLQEKTKVKALSEELENPMNVHRWRKLEGSDPATYEMIQKIQTLQRRLISKTEDVVEKDLQLQEKEKLYIELKNILARQPGPEVAEQLSVYQQSLKEKTRQMKAMASELNMYQAQVNEYKYELERLTRELQAVKRKYYEHKKREQMRAEGAAGEAMSATRLKAAQQALQQQYTAQAATARFTGGGFSLNQ